MAGNRTSKAYGGGAANTEGTGIKFWKNLRKSDFLKLNLICLKKDYSAQGSCYSWLAFSFFLYFRNFSARLFYLFLFLCCFLFRQQFCNYQFDALVAETDFSRMIQALKNPTTQSTAFIAVKGGLWMIAVLQAYRVLKP